MPNSPTSSNASAPFRPAEPGCRIDWRPSRLLASILAAMGVLAAVSLLGCAMPLAWSVPMAVLAAGYGLVLARREMARASHALVLARGQGMLDGRRIDDVALAWRGPLAFLHFRDADGRRRRLAWWPDTLDARARRELRLAMPVQAAAQPPTSMAS